MSRRELKALQVENTELTTGNRSGRTRGVMDGGAELADKVRSLEAELAEVRETIVSKDEELDNLRSQLNEAKAESDRAHHKAAETVRVLEQQLESERVQAELTHLRALESLRAEHQLAIQREKDAMDEERKRMSVWVQDVKDSCDKEKKHLEERVEALLKEKETCVPDVGGATDRSTHASTERSEDSTTDHTTPASDPPTDPGGGGAGGGGGATDTTPPPSTVTSTGTSTGDAPRSAATGMVETMTTFLQTQAEAMAAHARATAAQQLPALPLYTGEGKQAADDGFERWIDRFKERAKVAG